LCCSEWIDLHERAGIERQTLQSRTDQLNAVQHQLHDHPADAVRVINELQEAIAGTLGNKQSFLQQLSSVLEDQPLIVVTGVSWRDLASSRWDEDEALSLSQLPDLIDLDERVTGSQGVERLVLLAGTVNLAIDHQAAAETLMGFLDALMATDRVQDVIPVTKTLTQSPAMNLPSDTVLMGDDPNAFVIAIRTVT